MSSFLKGIFIYLCLYIPVLRRVYIPMRAVPMVARRESQISWAGVTGASESLNMGTGIPNWGPLLPALSHWAISPSLTFQSRHHICFISALSRRRKGLYWWQYACVCELSLPFSFLGNKIQLRRNRKKPEPGGLPRIPVDLWAGGDAFHRDRRSKWSPGVPNYPALMRLSTCSILEQSIYPECLHCYLHTCQRVQLKVWNEFAHWQNLTHLPQTRHHDRYPHVGWLSLQVFDVLPLYGVLRPYSSHQISFTFYGHCDIIAKAKALCEVEGGPTYEIVLKGEASLVSYSFDTKDINYGLQVVQTSGGDFLALP